MKSQWKFIYFHSRKCIRRCRLENGDILPRPQCVKMFSNIVRFLKGMDVLNQVNRVKIFSKHIKMCWPCEHKKSSLHGPALLFRVHRSIVLVNMVRSYPVCLAQHEDVVKWKHLPRYWSFVQGIHLSPMNSTHNGQWRRALNLSLICA